ncbi:unnamed protein product [Knipowitschia caucasica]
MNVTEMTNSSIAAATPRAVTEGITKPSGVATTYSEANTTINDVITTALPASTDGTIVAVVIFVILLTVAVVGFLLYRYLCHNKGDYRTTGELAPGEDAEETSQIHKGTEKKEYFI